MQIRGVGEKYLGPLTRFGGHKERFLPLRDDIVRLVDGVVVTQLTMLDTDLTITPLCQLRGFIHLLEDIVVEDEG